MPELLQPVFDLAPRRLLVMACTATKRDDHLLLPAGERYVGPSFRLLRRWQREHPAAATRLDVYILSAAFGFISADQLIPDYNHRLTPADAARLHDEVLCGVCSVVTRAPFSGAYLSAGRLYLSIFGCSSPAVVFAPVPLALPPPGLGIGGQLAALKAWLLAGCTERSAA